MTHESPSRETQETRETEWWDSSISLRDLNDVVFPPLSYLVDGLIVQGGLTLIAGAPKAGKSVLAMGCSLAVASGTPALGGIPSRQTGVLFISLDDQSRPRAQRRVRDLLNGADVPTGMVLHTEPNLGTGLRAAERLHEYLEAHPSCGLVVIDTLEHLRGEKPQGMSVYTADVKFLDTLRRVSAAHPQVAIVALTHTRKGDGDDDPIEAVSGSHGVTGGADAVLVLSGRRGVPRRRLDVVSRDDEDRTLVLAISQHGLTLTDDDPEDPTVLLTEDDAAIYRAVCEFPDGVTAADLSSVFPHMPKIGNRLMSLKKKGLLQQQGRGVFRA